MTLNGVMAIILHYFAEFGRPTFRHFRGQLRTRNSLGDEIANVNFLYDNIVHAIENTIDSCINSATDHFPATQVYQIH